MTTEQPTAAPALPPDVPLDVGLEVVRVAEKMRQEATARGHRAHEKLAAFIIIDGAEGSVRALLHTRATVRGMTIISPDLRAALDIADAPGELRMFVRYADRADDAEEETVLLSEWRRRFATKERG